MKEEKSLTPLMPPILLRTILEKTWVRDGEIHYTAFQPRENEVESISLFFEKKEAGERFDNPIFGFINVVKEEVEKVSNGEFMLKVRDDSATDPGHASLIGIPAFRHLDKKDSSRKALKKQCEMIASEVAEKASEINEYLPDGVSPKIYVEEEFLKEAQV